MVMSFFFKAFSPIIAESLQTAGQHYKCVFIPLDGIYFSNTGNTVVTEENFIER